MIKRCDPTGLHRFITLIHNYRWRLGLAKGEPSYHDLKKLLAKASVIAVPAITRKGDANGVPHPNATAYAKKIADKYTPNHQPRH